MAGREKSLISLIDHLFLITNSTPPSCVNFILKEKKQGRKSGSGKFPWK